jgi:branched-chain amino acid transport system substrate-binding protein
MMLGATAIITTAAPAGAAKPSTLTIGAINETSGSCIARPIQDVPDTLTSWEKWVNPHGGIAGHPVSVIQYNDNCDAGQSVADAQKLISAHVLAIIDGTGLDSSWSSAVTAAHIPVLCGIQTGNGLNCFANANFFPAGATVLSSLYGNVLAAKKAGAKSFGVIYCTEVAACAQALPLFKGYATQLGLQYAPPLAASETATSYAAQCVTYQQAHVNAVFPAGPPANTLAADCAQQGYHPIVTLSSGTWLNSYLRVSAMNGTTGTTSDIPWSINNAATSAFHKATGNLVHTASSPYNVSVTWAAALLFQYAAAHVGSKVTTASIYQGLYAMHDDTLGGFAPPLTFVKGKSTSVPCFFVVSIKKGAFTAPNGGKYGCEPTS